LIATAFILSVSAFESLRESAAMKGIEEFFAQRRQGAKKTRESNVGIAVPNLSAFASLREISGKEDRRNFSRQGAKTQRTELSQRSAVRSEAMKTAINHQPSTMS
jgi:hypothetical protein